MCIYESTVTKGREGCNEDVKKKKKEAVKNIVVLLLSEESGGNIWTRFLSFACLTILSLNPAGVDFYPLNRFTVEKQCDIIYATQSSILSTKLNE